MALTPSETVRFESWKELHQWLPHASEAQLLTVFVWAGDQQALAPAVEERRLGQIRKEAFERLVEKTREPVKRYLMKRQNCRDVHLADDVVQEVLIQLYRRAEQFDPQRSFWGWLYRIARNKYIDALRRLRPGDVGTGPAWTDEADNALEHWLQQQGRVSPSAETAVLDQERRQRLDAALGKLPANQRTICRLKLDGVKGTEIAKQIGKSQAFVSQAFHEALELIRDWMDE